MVSEPTQTAGPGHLGPVDDATIDADTFPRAFGNYVLLDRLAEGGMGSVFLAKTGGEVGIERHCVLKTLRERFTGNADYVERFMHEARVVVQLSHRNICPVFDVGRVGPAYYLAMELVIGRDARTVVSTLASHGHRLPVPVALHILCETLEALDYAHRHTDPVSGVPLHLVHRDVSPANVMISVEGEVKLIDFGLAESGKVGAEVPADSPSNATVMGKIAYMSPEHARGEALDARADEFSAGIVAYELLTSLRYYDGLNISQIWWQVGAGAHRPPSWGDVDQQLVAIVLRALSAKRDDRYPTCGEFRRALLAYARERGLHAEASDLRALMGAQFPEDAEHMRELLRRFAHVSNTARPGFASARSGAEQFTIAKSTLNPSQPQIRTEIVRQRTSDTTPLEPPPPQPRRRVALLAGLAAAAFTVAGIAAWFATRDTRPIVVQVQRPAEIPAPPVPPAPTPAPPVAVDPAAQVRDDPQPATATRKPPRKPPRFKARTTTEKLTVLRGCRGQLTCASKLLGQKEAGLDLLSNADMMRYNVNVDDCYDLCVK